MTGRKSDLFGIESNLDASYNVCHKADYSHKEHRVYVCEQLAGCYWCENVHFFNTLRMEVPNVESLLDYVFTDEDFSDTPSEKEYKKLCRVMKVAIL